MPRLNIDQDIKPLSEFRANAASFIQQVHRTRRPMVITHRGKSAAVLMDVAEYEGLMERLDLLEELQCAERQVDDGQGIPHDEALSHILGRIAQ
ncbi:type II toxin-antitoxin system Phd/YefM family antitoxin [Geobacter sp.]|uniref:type II toxin-antitoxin system Phd/YefM family antitoxin n=1 Tax=Geobacter sp. TaxID=46610 RepID=UPI0027B904F8|nr:type II toxin-antitoxin system Phd/YefM family antitoxin [Geobacter sp.]